LKTIPNRILSSLKNGSYAVTFLTLKGLVNLGKGKNIKTMTSRRYALRDDQWERIFEQLAADADNEYAMIDSTIVRAHQHSAGAKKKGSQTMKQLVEVKVV
jgi:transposase